MDKSLIAPHLNSDVYKTYDVKRGKIQHHDYIYMHLGKLILYWYCIRFGSGGEARIFNLSHPYAEGSEENYNLNFWCKVWAFPHHMPDLFLLYIKDVLR